MFSLLFQLEGCPPCVENLFRWLMDGLFDDSSNVEVFVVESLSIQSFSIEN